MTESKYYNLLKKYETKQPNEVWSKKSEYKNKKNQRLAKKINIANIKMNQLNIRGNDRKRVIKIIEEIPDFKEICCNCSYDLIISAICYYILKTKKSYLKIEDYNLFNEDGLNYKNYSTIISKVLYFYQKKKPVLRDYRY